MARQILVDRDPTAWDLEKAQYDKIASGLGRAASDYHKEKKEETKRQRALKQKEKAQQEQMELEALRQGMSMEEIEAARSQQPSMETETPKEESGIFGGLFGSKKEEKPQAQEPRGLSRLLATRMGENQRQAREKAKTVERRKGVDALRKEVTANPATRDLTKIDAAFGKVMNSAKKATAGGDLAMVFNFMKMLDPGSTVREGEFANAAAAAGMPDRMIQYAKKIDDGTILTPEQRQDFLNVAKDSAAAQFQSYERSMEPLRASAEERGYDPGRIFPKFESKRFLQTEKEEAVPPQQQIAEQNIPVGLKRMEVPKPGQGSNLLDSVIPPVNAAPQGREILNPERTKQRRSRMQELRQRMP